MVVCNFYSSFEMDIGFSNYNVVWLDGFGVFLEILYYYSIKKLNCYS